MLQNTINWKIGLLCFVFLAGRPGMSYAEEPVDRQGPARQPDAVHHSEPDQRQPIQHRAAQQQPAQHQADQRQPVQHQAVQPQPAQPQADQQRSRQRQAAQHQPVQRPPAASRQHSNARREQVWRPAPDFSWATLAFAEMDAMLAEMSVVPATVEYVPVPVPLAVTPADTTALNLITVTVPNRAGGYATLNLMRLGDGFLGPQGEFYPTFPTSTQLMLMYGQ